MTALTQAWQAALAAEHRAAFAYGLVGAQLNASSQLALVIACSNAHEALRNSTEAEMTASGVVPVPPQADYPDLYPVSTPAQARAISIRVEDGCAAAWRFLYSVAAGQTGADARRLRPRAQSGLTASAVRGTRWRKIVRPSAATVAFPGLP
ncbi:MAG: DUF4439 domain-containing protein [Jatrophihabitantaceae bacterium]